MAKKEKLFELVHSLTGAEKRYFKVFASGSEPKTNNQYLQLFDILSSQDEYDEPEILRSFGGQSFKSQLPVVKHYLYNQILRSLRNYNSGNITDFKIKEMLMNAEILFRKGLLQHCRDILRKAENLALENEKFELLLETYSFQLSLLLKISDPDPVEVKREVDKIMEAATRTFEKYMNILLYKKLSYEMLLLNRQEQFMRESEQGEGLSELVNRAENPETLVSLPVRSRIYLLQSGFIFHYARWDLEKSREFADRIVSLMEEYPFIAEERPDNYIFSLHNLIAVSIQGMDLEEGLSLIKKLRTVADRFPRVKIPKGIILNAQLLSWNLEFSFYLTRNQFASGVHAIAEFERWSKTKKFKINLSEGFTLFDVWFQAGKILFHLGKNKEALVFMDKILKSPLMNPRLEMHLISRLFKVLILFEMEEIDAFQSAARSVYRSIKGRGTGSELEKSILMLLNLLKRLPAESVFRDQMKLIQDQLKELQTSPGDARFLQQSNILPWIDRKIKGQRFAQMAS